MLVGEEEAGADRGGELVLQSLERVVASQCLPPTRLCKLAAKIPAGTVRELSDRVWDHISVERVSSKHFSRQARIASFPNRKRAKTLACFERVFFCFQTFKNVTKIQSRRKFRVDTVFLKKNQGRIVTS
jgi:hypothetical protein